MDQYIGKMLDDRYEILELIGTGGMANVYKARCHRLNRLVAIKILKSDLADNADFRRRLIHLRASLPENLLMLHLRSELLCVSCGRERK